MGEIERRLFWTKATRNTLKYRVKDWLDTLNRNIATSDPFSYRRGYFRWWKVTSSFSAKIFHRDQLERWRYHRCVQADDTDRLICNMSMTFPDQVMILTLGQFFKMTFQGQIIVVWCVWFREKRLLAKWLLCFYWVKNYYRKLFFVKWLFLLSGGQAVDLRSNLTSLQQKGVKKPIGCAFSRRCSSSGSWVMCRLVENV